MEKTLTSIPSLVPLYAKAAVGSAQKRPTSIDIAVDSLVVHDVAVTRTRDIAFRDAVGADASDDAFFGHIHALIMPIQMELMAADDFPLPMMGLVHTSNSYRQLRPIPVDQSVSLRVGVDQFRAHRAGTEVVLRATVTDAAEHTVLAEEESVYLARGVRLDDANDAGEGTSGAGAANSAAPSRAPFTPPFPTAAWRLGADTGRRWATVSGDWNPIHITGLSAKLLGMPGAIAHGMYTASRALAESSLTPGEPYEFTVQFAAPVVLPTTANVAITRAGDIVRSTDGTTVGIGGMDIVAWDRKKKRPYFTATVRDIA